MISSDLYQKIPTFYSRDFFVTKLSQFSWFTFQKRCYNTELNKEVINQIYESD